MPTTVHAYAAAKAGAALHPFDYSLGDLGPDDVDIRVAYCGLCHSDLSMINNEWGMSRYPIVPGHEVVGTVAAVGEHVPDLRVGDRVGLGWYASSCMHCDQCVGGRQHLCPDTTHTIGGRHGGFADHVRCHWIWAAKIPEGLDPATVGPLFCGGITVFSPILQAGVLPTQRVGVIGIGGLGHLALQFLAKWGCHVTAFTSSPDKAADALAMGAHAVVDSRSDADLAGVADSLDFILNTTNVTLNWQAYLDALAPDGTLHNVGAVLDPMPIPAFSLISGQKKVAGSPLGAPKLVRDMLRFCERHAIAPVTEQFALADINDALEHLEAGKARYRIVLKV